MTATLPTGTVETFLMMARDAILSTADLKPDEYERLANVKVTYGMGDGSYRGITAYGAWKRGTPGTDELSDAHSTTDFIEIAATAQESWIQLAGTLLHELGHSLAGMGTGHGKAWKSECVRLGFVKEPAAAGQRYWLSLFRPELRLALYGIARVLRDGSPNFWTRGMSGAGVATVKPCRAGQGTRGGKSRGTGSGSRLRLWECGCERPVKVRVASDAFDATCNVCAQPFERK
jgi:hypothetical protein